MSTVKRRQASRQAEYPVGRFWLRFIHGDGSHDLTVDPARCPRSIQARGHWHAGAGEQVYDEQHGEWVTLAECGCGTEDE